jgi:hypothetical protein
MAAAELTSAANARRGGRRLACAALLSSLTLWSITLSGAGLVRLTAQAPARRLMHLQLRPASNPTPSLAHVFSIAAHNLPICAWPLLIGSLGLRGRSSWRRALDVTVAACALANVLPVAVAIGGYGRALLPYVPQVPLEWAALALGYASWTVQRRNPLTCTQRLVLAAVISLLLLGAGALETYGVPHR